MKSRFVLWPLALILFNVNYSLGQNVIKIRSNATKEVYCLKASGTQVDVRFHDATSPIRDAIDSVDSTGVYFTEYGLIAFSRIHSLKFKPYWPFVPVMNAIYYTSMINLLGLAAYNTLGGEYGSGIGLIIMSVSIPIWAGVVPGIVNLLIYAAKPRVTLSQLDGYFFIK